MINNNPKFTSLARPAPDSGIPRIFVEFAVENKVKADQRNARVLARKIPPVAKVEEPRKKKRIEEPRKKTKRVEADEPRKKTKRGEEPKKRLVDPVEDPVKRPNSEIKAAIADGRLARWFDT